jgi:hypothetical protein
VAINATQVKLLIFWSGFVMANVTALAMTFFSWIVLELVTQGSRDLHATLAILAGSYLLFNLILIIMIYQRIKYKSRIIISVMGTTKRLLRDLTQHNYLEKVFIDCVLSKLRIKHVFLVLGLLFALKILNPTSAWKEFHKT